MMRWTLAALLLASPPFDAAPPPFVWGAHGHTIAGRAAATGLPGELPTFFRDAGDQLAYLNPEPDRWRERTLEGMDEAWSYDHYIDLENVPDGALDAEDRWAYLDRVYAAGLDNPVRDTGFLPYRILELYQRLETEWRLWRAAPDDRRPWIEERIVQDAGLLGHYVTDASQPHHTTIHFNGWASDRPNPEGYTTDRRFHARFESDFVEANVTVEDLLATQRWRAGTLDDPWAAILAHVREAHDAVEPLYRIDRDVGFDGPSAEAHDFTVERLVAGVDVLRDLWWTAWVRSARPVR